jgi:hypothetical protein
MLRTLPNLVSVLTRPRVFLVAFAGSLLAISGAAAQESPAGPQAPPPEHKIDRVVGTPQPEAPPDLPPAQIVSAFTKKEDLYQAERPLYSYRRTIRIQEFGPDGKPAGEYNATYQAVRSSNGQLYEKARSTVTFLKSIPKRSTVSIRCSTALSGWIRNIWKS